MPETIQDPANDDLELDLIAETHNEPEDNESTIDSMMRQLQEEGIDPNTSLSDLKGQREVGDDSPLPSAGGDNAVQQAAQQQVTEAAAAADQTVADYIANTYGDFGKSLVDKYGGDEAALVQGLVNAAQVVSTRDEDSQIGRMVRSQWPAFQQFLASQNGGQIPPAPQQGYYPPVHPQQGQQAQAPPQQTQPDRPRFNPAWDTMQGKDPETGETKWLGSAEEQVKYKKWLEYANERQVKLIDDPESLLESLGLEERVTKAVQQSLGEFQKTQEAKIADERFAQSFVAENQGWMFKGGKMPTTAAAPGQSHLSEAGTKFFTNYSQIMQSAPGISPNVAADYATKAVMADYARQMQFAPPTGQQPAPPQGTPQAVPQAQQPYNRLAPATNQPSLSQRPLGEGSEFTGDIVKDTMRMLEEAGIKPGATLDELRRMK